MAIYVLPVTLLPPTEARPGAAQPLSDPSADNYFSFSFDWAGQQLLSSQSWFYPFSSPPSSSIAADGATPLNRARRLSPGGLDPAVINSFPIIDYSDIKHLKMGDKTVTCAVCVSEFGDNERLRLLPKCDHVFHPECIDPWLASHSTRPICRATLSQGMESTQSNGGLYPGPELVEVQIQNQISVIVNETEVPRYRVRMFPRPHSTGHSLVQLGEDHERYTPRLPEEGRRQVDRGGTSDRWFRIDASIFQSAGSENFKNMELVKNT